MKKKYSAFLLILLAAIVVTTSCDNSDDGNNSTPDPSIIGLWKLKNTVYEITSNDAAATLLIKEDFDKNHGFLQDSLQFFSNGYFSDRQMIVPHPSPQYSKDIQTAFTFKTKKNIVETIPAPMSSISGFKARYNIPEFTTMILTPQLGAIDYYKSGRYLHYLGLDSTKVSVTKLEVRGYYEKVIYYTGD